MEIGRTTIGKMEEQIKSLSSKVNRLLIEKPITEKPNSKIVIAVLAAGALAMAIIGSGCSTAPKPKPKTPVTTAAATASVPSTCPDGDQDGVCDADDLCLTETGPKATFGCPIDPCNGSPLMVLVQFNYDSFEMPAKKSGVQTMDPVLDAVAEAIVKDASCRVCIIGHASEEGTPEYNDELSNNRASAVQDYMVNHNLAETRLPTTGMGERCQLTPKSTRMLNRRVEFRRLDKGQFCPSDCS